MHPNRLFLKALIITLLRPVATIHVLLAVLPKPTSTIAQPDSLVTLEIPLPN